MDTKQTFSSSFLNDSFEEFYNMVSAQKRAIDQKKLRDSAVSYGESVSETRDELIEDRVSLNVQELRLLFEEQAMQAMTRGGALGSSLYREAQYAMVVLADEIFLHMAWEGREQWKMMLLEEQIFGTHVGGEKFFFNMEALLKEQNPFKRNLGTIYLKCLALGFKGRYSGPSQNVVKEYKQALFLFIHRQSALFFEKNTPLFGQPLLYTTTTNTVGKSYKDIRTWGAMFLGLCAAYVMASYMVWRHTTHNIRAVLHEINRDVEKMRS